MTMNDLTAPLGQDPKRHRRAIDLPVAQIVAVALGLFFGAFVLWAVIAKDPSGGEPIAVAPADLRLAKKAPEVIAVPQAPADSSQAATTASAPAKPPSGVTVTIIDAKSGAKREVLVATPPQPERTQADQTSADTTGQLPTEPQLPAQLPNRVPAQPSKKR